MWQKRYVKNGFIQLDFHFGWKSFFFFNLFLYEEQQPSFVCGSVWKDWLLKMSVSFDTLFYLQYGIST